ncbi:MAG: manganese efflux pump MntP family protein, partial [Sphaerochaeta sp.]|uniref:manganese efflux pump MntP n=1 Tax=Sphaerochaeta sp. TaxID=1972642 RepID=UPI003D136791
SNIHGFFLNLEFQAENSYTQLHEMLEDPLLGIIELLMLSVGLAMDAFAVSLCKGLRMRRINWPQGILIAFSFGFFQAGMPLIGWSLGHQFERFITPVDHWIAFILLSLVGAKMLYDSITEDPTCPVETVDHIDLKELLLLSVATSIDALAVGITLAFLNTDIILSTSLIGIVTFFLSLLAVIIGNHFGNRLQSKAGILGGIVLILIGGKILFSHLGIIGF